MVVVGDGFDDGKEAGGISGRISLSTNNAINNAPTAKNNAVFLSILLFKLGLSCWPPSGFAFTVSSIFIASICCC